MNIDIFQNILTELKELKESPVNQEKTLIEIKEKVDLLKFEKDSITFRKNEQLISIIEKYLTNAISSISKKRKYKEIDFQFSEDIYYHLDSLSKLPKTHFLFSEEINFNVESICDFLETIIIPNRKTTNEAELEKHIFNVLIGIYGKEKIHRQFNIGGFLGLKTDIDIGNGQIGIELKVGHSLGASEMQRLLGQVIYYRNRFYNENLILFISGKNEIDSKLNELIEFVREIGIKTVYRKSMKI